MSLVYSQQQESARGKVTRAALSNVLSAKSRLIVAQMAFGVKMDTLMRMQSAYDIARTRAREKSIRVRPYESQAASGRMTSF